MAAMAIADGYQADLSPVEIEAHTTNCVDCRQEIGQLRSLSRLLDTQKRKLQFANTWAALEGRLPAGSAEQNSTPQRYMFLVLGAMLLGYRLVELIPNRDLIWLFKLSPIILVVAAFIYLRENPFKINAELRFEGE
jgi:predicted anti-sigma-YlaC factor YlaD